MLDDLMVNLDFKSDYDLEIMDKCNGLMDILVNSLEGLDKIVKKEKPEIIFVHGDTSATLAGSIVAFYNKIELAHIEAGLRTYDKYSPYPEEINRQITGVIADIHFTSTKNTRENLLQENKDIKSIHVVGNTAIDTLKYTIVENYKNKSLDFLDDKYILITAHRRENLDIMNNIFKAINHLVKVNKDIKFIYPIHLNPVIRQKADQYLLEDNIKIIEPLDTIDFHNVLKKSFFVMSDSGGIQEAPALNKPVLVLRNTTERPKGIEAGTLKLVGIEYENIVAKAQELIANEQEYKKMSNCANPYGDGTTSMQIVNIIKNK